MFNIGSARSSIVGLLFLCGPAAIAWFVVTILVWKAVNCQKWGWPSAHINNEVWEAATPTATDFDSASTVIGIAFVFLIFTASNHSGPNVILRPSHAATGRTVSQSWSASLFKFSQNATATLSGSIFKIISRHIFNGSAVANTSPIEMSAGPSGSLLDKKSSEFLPYQIPEMDFPDYRCISVSLPAMVMHQAKPALFSILFATGNTAFHGNNYTIGDRV
jgi:hypothetical protein